jgi:hypothetical protein
MLGIKTRNFFPFKEIALLKYKEEMVIRDMGITEMLKSVKICEKEETKKNRHTGGNKECFEDVIGRENEKRLLRLVNR